MGVVPLKSLLQVSLLLIAGQVVLGAAGMAVSGWLPWLGLPFLFLFVWLIARTGSVVRQEMADAVKRKQPVVPWRLVVATIVVWQAPAVVGAALSPWLPVWLGSLWHGTMLPVVGSVDLIFSAGKLQDAVWWPYAASLLEVALFAFAAGRPVYRPVVPQQPVAQARAMVAAGEWAPARRHKDVVKKYNPNRQDKE